MRAEKPELAMNTRGGCASLLITTHLNKLKAQPQGVGTEVMITAKAVIRGPSARETDDGVNRSADLRITDMAIAPVSGDVEKSAAETPTVTGE